MRSQSQLSKVIKRMLLKYLKHSAGIFLIQNDVPLPCLFYDIKDVRTTREHKYQQFIAREAQTLPHWCSARQLKIFLQLTKLTVMWSKWTTTTSLKIQSLMSWVRSLPCREVHLALPAVQSSQTVSVLGNSLYCSSRLNTSHRGRCGVSPMLTASAELKNRCGFTIS